MKKLIYYILLFFPVLVFGQSINQNYVKKVIYKEGTTLVLPVSPDPKKGLVNISYFDGLGRPIQQIAHKQSGTGTDIVTHIEYGAFGRQEKDFLPYVTTAANPNFRTDAPSRVVSYYQDNYNDAYPFSEKKFENSPLNRVLRQGAPGEAWQIMLQYTSDNTIAFNYRSNGENEVRFFKANTSAAVNSNGFYTISLGNAAGDVYYPGNELYKTVIADENNSKTAEFKDKEGRVVLKRTFPFLETDYDDINHHNTYYVYDNYGNLTYVIPPKALDMGTITPTVLNNLCYQYRYDARNRVVEKKLPGKAWEYIVYDKLDRVVATGPALSPFSDSPSQIGWLITKYDALGRVAYTGWNVVVGTFNSTTRSFLQNTVNNMTNLYVTRQNGLIENINVGYANNSTQPAVTRVLTINYYDNYSYPTAPVTLPPFTISELGDAGDVTDKVKGLMTGSWVRVLTTSSEKLFELTHIFYDVKGRPIRTYQKNHLGGFTQNDTQLDFIGNPLKVITTHKYDSATAAVITVTEDFEYTPQGRLSEHKHKINNGATETLSYNEYDELGQLDRKKVGRTANTPLQTVDYKYNIRGWLTDINDVDTLGDDLFAFKLSYNQIAHPYTPGMPAPYYFPLYNGNISETYWKTSTDNILRKYGYQYDRLSRLVNAYYIKPSVSSDNATPRGNYNESVTYDKNGNITSIWRHGDLDSSVDRIVIDNLSYTYDSGNKLVKVTDSSNHPEGFNDTVDNPEEYEYDSYGNMTRDDNKGIEGIAYNHLNLPKKIIFSNSTQNISYLYNALGVKVEKKVYRPGTGSNPFNGPYTTTTNYLSGFHYEFNDAPLQVLTSKLKFFATAEGYVNVSTGGRVGLNDPGYVFNYVYNYTDHLGNVRLSYTRGTGNNPPVILEENHYYPFGLKHKKYGSVDKDFVEIDGVNGYYVGIDVVPQQSRKSYQYKYNGKEFQDELGLNVHDFHFRQYMQDLGRTTTLDPHAENYSSFSPYSFLNNNPINFIDPDGKDGIRIIDKKNKTIIIKAFYFVQTEQSTYYNIKGKMKKLDGYSTKDVAYMQENYNKYLNDLKMTVSDGEYKGYSVSFDLQFREGGTIEQSQESAKNTLEQGYSIGNSISRGSPATYPRFRTKTIDNGDGTYNTSTVGGITIDKKDIHMNRNEDSKMNRIHEIFHTFGFNDFKRGETGNGIMKYPPQKPNQSDANDLGNGSFLPKVFIDEK